MHRTFHNLSSRYGPLIYLKLGSIPCAVASSPELAKELLKTHELTFTSRKNSTAIDHLTYKVSFAFSPLGPYWKFIKKLCTWELLGNRTLNHFLPIRMEEYKRFLGVLAERSSLGESVNLTEELLKLTNNVISHMMLSTRCSGTQDQASAARTVVREVTQIFGEFNVSDIIWFCKNIDLQGFRQRIEDVHRRYDALLEKFITDREQVRKVNKENRGKSTCEGGDDEVKDFLDIMLDIMEDENAEVQITRDHIKALVLDFFTAATDTTAITLEWALAELINNPAVHQKAQEEIDKVVGSNRLVQESDGPNLPYIQAVIKETFRLHPPIPMLARKSIQGCKINGYFIPAHTLLFVNIWSMGRNPKYWDSPLEFRPERFLESCEGGPMGLIDVKGQHYQLLPFGTGRRGCPGMSLAMQEVSMVLSAMIQCFEWKVVGPLNMEERPGLTAPRAYDLVCSPVARFIPLDNINP